MNLNQAKELTLYYINKRKPVFWWGAPGVGKTKVINQFASELRRTVMDWRTNLRDPVDARGLPVPDLEKQVTRWMRPNDLPFEGSDYPDDTIVFMDEANTGSPAMQVVAMQIVHERRAGEHRLKPGVDIIAAGNRQSDRAAAQRMPTALANRFAHIDVDPDVDTTVKHFIDIDIDPLLVAFLRFRPALLHNMEGTDLRAFPTPRSWEDVGRMLDAPAQLRPGLVRGLVGEGAAAEFEGFVRVYQQLPSLDLVLANPNSAPVPTEPAAKFAIAAGLSRKVDAKSFENGMIYVQRISGREFEIMFTVDAVRRDNKLSHTQAFTDWAVRNQDVTFN